ncbi:hypothetical protein F4777DRAFT_565377 [Nemania sp. FL0916]|nr:hypothetical protein F4777DRAFT_565377 [Nemania sp. FL0916]
MAAAQAMALFSGPPIEPSDTSARTSAPYGQACINCAKAKCRCILVPPTNAGSGRASKPTCERCARLGRECKPSSSIRKRGAAGSRRAATGLASAGGSRGMSAASRAANLEQKLEDLVAILKAQTGSTQDGGEPQRPGRRDQDVRDELEATLSSVSARRSSNTRSRVVSSGPNVMTPASTGHGTSSTANSTPSPLPVPVHDTLASGAQAEETLSFFRQHHLKFFPFVHLPLNITAAKLQRDRPYLWLNIQAVCCRSPVKQAALSQQSRSELAHRMLVTCERNIDMLLGVLCLLGWTMHLCFRPSMTAKMGMATSIVADLRLDKPGQEDDPRIINCFKSNDFVKAPHSLVRTMEERRATLACYVFCSTGSAFLRCSSMRWTSHMDDCLKMLDENPEWEGDQILVLMVRIRKLSDHISQVQTTGASEFDGHSSPKMPPSIYIKYFRQCLQTIRDQVPESLRDNRLATSLLMSADVLVSEIPFSPPSPWSHVPELRADASSTRQPGAPQSASRPMDLGRIEANFATLQTSRAFFEHFLTFELSDLVGISFPVLLNFFRSAQILYRLRVVDESDWDRATVTNTVDVLAGLDLMGRRYAQLPAIYGFLTEADADGNEVTNFYVKCAKTFNSTSPMWRTHFAQADASAGAEVGGGDANAQASAGAQVPPALMGNGLHPNLGPRMNYHGTNNYGMQEMFPIDFSMDDAWYNDILSSWDTSTLGPML